HRPGGAGKIAKAVERHDGGFLERRNVKRGRQMGEMMLDIVEHAAKALTGKCFGQQLRDRLPLAAVPQPIYRNSVARKMGYRIADHAKEIGATVLVDGDMIQIGQSNPGFTQTKRDRLARETRPMLDAPKSFLLGRRDKNTVAHQSGRGVTVECIKP